MSYEIPDKVRYKEKIFMNMDFKQLFYLVIFGSLAWASYGLPIEGDEKFILPAFFACLGAGFIFLDFEEALLCRFSFYSNVRLGGALDKKVRSFIGVNKIESDTIYLNNGEMRAVILVRPINFLLLDEAWKKSVILNYRDFLNQLAFPLQILVRTVNVNLYEYFGGNEAKILSSGNEKLISLYNDFKLYEEKFLKENFVKERLHYVIIPYTPIKGPMATKVSDVLTDTRNVFKKATRSKEGFSEKQSRLFHKELNERVRLIQNKLGNCGLTSYRLSTNQLISLLMSYFEGHIEVDENYLSRITVCKSFFESKEGDKDEK